MSSADEKNNESTDSTEIESPGIRLLRAREACDLTHEDVASHLKLSVEKIKSLESGEVENIAAPVFVAGYLRSYARLVHISGDEIVADFKALAVMQSPSMDPASGPAANDYGQVGGASPLNMSLSGKNALGVPLILGVVIVLIVVGIYVFLSSGDAVTIEKKISSNTVGETNSAKSLLPELSLDHRAPETSVSVPRESIKISLKKEELLEKPAAATIPAPFPASIKNDMEGTGELKDASNELESNADISELSLYFTEDSWVEVGDSTGKRLLYRLAKVGMSHTVSGFAPFNVHLGYVNGVNVMYNGESYDLSRFVKGKSARFQVGVKKARMSENQ
ncbi:MAG: RodZ domain-containing protein [Gammaproteobacteria bacterium]